MGQIYVPAINWALLLASAGLVVAFGTSSRLAAAYGIAVTLTMAITTLLAYFVARYAWHWSFPAALALTLALGAVDAAFLGANALKILDGGWFPLLVGAAVLALLTTWKRGRMLLGKHFQARMEPLDDFIAHVVREGTTRVRGTAVYMSGTAAIAPPALLSNLAHNHVVHEHVIVLTVVTEEIARVAAERRIQIEPHGHGFWRVVARYGFMEDPDVPTLLAQARVPDYDEQDVTFFLGRETIVPTERRPGMALWREKIFAFMARNAQPATALFGLPPERVMEIGELVEM